MASLLGVSHTKVRTNRGAVTASYLLVLVRRHGDELRLLEHVRAERAVRQLEDVVGAHQVKTRLIFMHGVENGLKEAQSGLNESN